MVNSRSTHACLVALMTLAASGAHAQFTRQYSAPGAFEEPPETSVRRLEAAVDQAKWRFGRLYLDPWFGLRDLAYDDRAGAEEGQRISDLTATVGAGVRGYVPVGSDLTFALHLLPEYRWWQDLAGRRQLNGRAGAGLFGRLGGRAAVEATVSREDDARFLNRELEARIDTRDERATLAFEIDLGSEVVLFLSGAVRELRFSDAGEGVPEVSDLDRDEEAARAGLRFRTPSGWSFGVGAERQEADFADPASGRSSTGTSPFVELGYDGPRLFVAAEVLLREWRPTDGPAFLDYEEPGGSARASLALAGDLRLQLSARRDLVYSFRDQWAYYEETALGAGLRAPLGRRYQLRVFAEDGDDEYAAFDPASALRIDDFTSVGAELSIKLGSARLLLHASSTDYTSTLPGFERTVDRVGATVLFGERRFNPWW